VQEIQQQRQQQRQQQQQQQVFFVHSYNYLKHKGLAKCVRGWSI